MNKTLRLFTLLAVFLLASGYAYAKSGNITFADAAVKAICVDNWDTNGDGELSYDEAAAVKNLSSWVFSRNTDITSFDELQYFTGLKSIGTMAFSDCSNLTNISIPSSVANIGDYAFSGCASLTSVTIPESVASIGGGAFSGCSGLNRIRVDNGNSVYDSRNDCNAIIETASNTLIVGCQNTLIHDGVINIGDYAFEGCKGLTNITIPSSVASIGEYAFEGCKGLTNITIPSSVASIGEYAFGNCLGLTSVTISDGIASIGENAFYSCYSLASITIPKSVANISNYAFRECSSLTSIIVEGGNETYDSRNDCNAIIETSSNKLIVGCQNTIIPDGVVSIGDYAFDGCAGLASMTIPEGVISIGKNAFNECTGLTSVTIPMSVMSIGTEAFRWCDGLLSVISRVEDPFVISSDVFAYWNPYAMKTVFTTATLYVPAGTKEKYLATPAWNQFQNIVEMEDTNIQFADATVKAICVANWDTNGDGELSYDEAAAVTELGFAFGDKKEITSFDELQYFTGLTTIDVFEFVSCSGLTSVTIPESVTSIGQSAFSGCSSLTSITIPESVTSIDGWAFEACSSLTNVTIPSSVTSISTYTFSGCSGLTGVTIPEGVTSIGSSAFSGCSDLTGVTIPASVTSIGSCAFEDCTSLTSVNIPEGLTSIGDGAFRGCSGLTSITVDGGNKFYDSRNDCNAIIKTSTNALIAGCQNTVIPNSVTSIGSSSFDGCLGLTSVTIPEGVTSIDSYAFYNCSDLKSITIPSSVSNIGLKAFCKCSGLTEVISLIEEPFDIDGSVILLYNNGQQYVFTSATLYVPAGTKEKYMAAEGWKLFENIVEMEDTNIHFADQKVKEICAANWDTNGDGELSYDEAAAVTDLGEVFLGWLHIGNRDITSFDELQFFTGLTSIGDLAFKGCTNLTSVTIPSSVTSIGSSAFESCNSLTSVTIPSSVTSIGSSAFSGCSSLTGVTIPLNVASIGENALESCSGLTSITVEEGNEVYDSRNDCNAIIETASNTLIAGCQNTVIPESVTSIGNGAFHGCSGLTSVTIPEGVTSIGNGAFHGCSGLTSVTIPEGVTSIGNSAFKYCSGLTSISIPESVMSIGEYGFRECTGLTEVTIPGSVSAIGNYAFDLCTGLTSVTILEGVESIGELAFCGCSSLTNVTIPESVTSIDEAAFSDCISLTSITIPESVTIISKDVFSRCSGLTNVTIPSGVTTIEYRAFEDCTSLTSVTIPSSVTSIGKRVFYGCTSLTSVTSLIEEPFEITSDVFENWNDETEQYDFTSATLYVPAGTKEKYLATPAWNQFQNIVEMEDTNIQFADATVKAICVENWDTNGDGELSYDEAAAVTELGFAFGDNKEITSFDELQYFTGLTSIGDDAFYGCSNLTSVTIPESVTSIGVEAFAHCYGLTSVTIPEGLTSVGDYAFEYSGLTSITIPEGVTSIGDRAFALCSGLTGISVASGNTVYDSREECNAIIETSTNTLIAGCQNTVIPNSVRIIGDEAFMGCTGLKSVTIPEGVTSIGCEAFDGCSGLTSITIPEGVTSIGDDAFSGCSGLTSVTIPLSVTSIGEGVFYGCTGLTSVTSLIEEPFEIGSDVFSNWNNETGEPDFTTATLYVPAGTKEKYLATPAWNQFLNIVEMGLEPVEQGETVDFGTDINADTDLDGNVVGDIYYSISGGNGAYNAAEGCIVVTTPTADNTMEGMTGTDIFGEDFNDHFTGIVFKVAEGKGTIKIEAQTTGTMVLKVKIGDNDPIEMELEGRLKVSFPYNVTEDTYIYIYGGESAAQANSMRRASSGSALKIYGIEIVKGEVDGIGTVMTEGDDDAPVYNLNGQRVKTPHRGVYIQNGKKVLVK